MLQPKPVSLDLSTKKNMFVVVIVFYVLGLAFYTLNASFGDPAEPDVLVETLAAMATAAYAAIMLESIYEVLVGDKGSANISKLRRGYCFFLVLKYLALVFLNALIASGSSAVVNTPDGQCLYVARSTSYVVGAGCVVFEMLMLGELSVKDWDFEIKMPLSLGVSQALSCLLGYSAGAPIFEEFYWLMMGPSILLFLLIFFAAYMLKIKLNVAEKNLREAQQCSMEKESAETTRVGSAKISCSLIRSSYYLSLSSCFCWSSFVAAFFFNREGYISNTTHFVIETIFDLTTKLLQAIIVKRTLLGIFDARNLLPDLVLEERDKTREVERFLRFIFHEVRVPLNSLSLGIDELKEPLEFDAESLELLECMSEGVSSMSDTLNSTLAMQKAQAGGFSAESAVPIDLADVLRITARLFESAVKKKQCQLKIDIDPMVPKHIFTCKGVIATCVRNYVSNAVKFCFDKTTIAVEARLCGSNRTHVEICVTNVGVPLEERGGRRLFRPFQQLRHGEMKGTEGTGLGLSFSKVLVEAVGGSVGVKSGPATNTFFVTLPVTRGGTVTVSQTLLTTTTPKTSSNDPDSEDPRSAMLPSQRPAPPQDLIKEPSNANDMDKSHDCEDPRSAMLPSERPAPQGKEPSNASPMRSSMLARLERIGCKHKVLVVDDVEVNRKLAARILTRCGLETETADSGHDCVRLLREALQDDSSTPFTTVLLDNEMPGMNGLEAASVIRNDPQLKDLLIVGLTGNALPKDVQGFIDAGADHVLIKPTNEKQLRKVLQLPARSKRRPKPNQKASLRDRQKH